MGMLRKPSSLRESLWYFASEIIALPVGLLLHIYLARELGLDRYGIFALAVAIVTTIEWSLAGVFSRATLFYLTGASRRESSVRVRLFRRHLLVGLVAGAAIFGFSQMLETEMQSALRILAVGTPLFLISLYIRSECIAQSRHYSRLILVVSRWITRLTVTWIVVSRGLEVEGAAYGVVAGWLAESLLGLSMFRPKMWSSDSSKLIDLDGFWKLAGVVGLCSVALRVFDKIDLLVLGAVTTDVTKTSCYAVAQNFASLPSFFAMAWTAVMLRVLRDRSDDDNEGTYVRDARSTIYGLVALLPISLLAGMTAKRWIPWIFGNGYLPSAEPFALLVLAANILAIGAGSTAVLIAESRPRWALYATLPIPLVALTAHSYVIPQFGMTGAAVVTLTCSVVSTGGLLLAVAKQVPSVLVSRPDIIKLICVLLVVLIAITFPVGELNVITSLFLLAISIAIAVAFLRCHNFKPR